MRQKVQRFFFSANVTCASPVMICDDSCCRRLGGSTAFETFRAPEDIMTFASVLTGFDRQLMRSNLEVVKGSTGCVAASTKEDRATS